MRFRIICLLLGVIVLVSGCAANAAGSEADRIREHYGALKEAEYTVTVRTDFGDRVLDYTVDYTSREDGSGHMVIKAPEYIAGVEAEFDAEGGTLQFEDTIIAFGELPGTGLSPMESLPFIIGQWSGGYVTQTGSETHAGRKQVTIGTRLTQDGVVIDVMSWFDAQSMAPVKAELSIQAGQSEAGVLTVSAFFE